MFYYYIDAYAHYVIFAIVGIFASIKLLTLKQVGIREGYFQLFIHSFGLYSEQTIKNTFHSRLKKFYKSSNKMNFFFYLTLVFFAFLYLFIASANTVRI